jgi:peptide/nickel transport system ATP-binding protein
MNSCHKAGLGGGLQALPKNRLRIRPTDLRLGWGPICAEMEPEILIADEAVSALDVSVQAQVLELLDDVKQRFDLAVLFITHDLRVAAQICDRIIVMEKGIVVEAGATHRVYTAPQHPYTRALLDAAPGRNFAFGKAA